MLTRCRGDAARVTSAEKNLTRLLYFDLKVAYNTFTKHPSSRHEWINDRAMHAKSVGKLGGASHKLSLKSNLARR